MSERLLPLPMTTLVTTDLIGVTRGRSFPTDELERYLKTVSYTHLTLPTKA